MNRFNLGKLLLTLSSVGFVILIVVGTVVSKEMTTEEKIALVSVVLLGVMMILGIILINEND